MRSSPVFSYYTGITPPITILPSSPTVKGFTADNLRGSVRYWRCPPAAARAPDLMQLRGNSLLDGLLGGRRGVYGGLHGSACFETGPAACQIARSCIASADCSRRARHLARRLARGASAQDSIRDGRCVLPGGSLASVRFGRLLAAFGACQTARATTTSRVR